MPLELTLGALKAYINHIYKTDLSLAKNYCKDYSLMNFTAEFFTLTK